MPNSSKDKIRAVLNSTVQSCTPHGKTHWPAAKRKARWEQKIIEEIKSRLCLDAACTLIAAYTEKRPWAIARFNEIDRQIKARRAR